MTPPSRRRFLTVTGAAGMLGLGGLVAACGGAGPAPTPAPTPAPSAPPPPGPPAATSATPSPSGTYTGDLEVVALCAALAALVADLYADAVAGAGQGRYGSVPGALSTFLQSAGAQHTAHAEAWNAVLTAAGRPAVEGTPLTVEPQLRSALGAAIAPTDLAELALTLENAVLATVTAATGEVSDPSAVAVGATVAPVASMHAATVSFLLGRLPQAPDDPTAGALGRDTLVA